MQILCPLILLLLAFPFTAFADHEPPHYSMAAKRGVLPTKNLAVIPPSTTPYGFGQRLGTDPAITAKLEDLLHGEPKVAWAALAVSGGNVLYEKYLKDGPDNLYPSWSMAKSITSLTVGYALCDGKIESLEDKAERYSEKLRGTPWGEAKLVDLLTMSSGASTTDLNTTEGDYRYRSGGLTHAVTRDQMTLRESFKVVGNDSRRRPPGAAFAYNNLDTEALGAVVSGATGQPFNEYFSQRVWPQIKPEHQAIWLLDTEKQTLVSTGFFASIRDYGRLATHLIDIYKGRSGNECLRKFLKDGTSPKKHGGGNIWYGYQFWIYGARGDLYALWGHQGQEIIINPEKEKFLVLTAYHSSIRNKYRDPNNLIAWLRSD